MDMELSEEQLMLRALVRRFARDEVAPGAARLLTYRAALKRQRDERCTAESAMAKLFASEVAARAVNHAVQIHGGYGYIKDYPVERFFRDARICEIGEGTSEIQRMVIARDLLDRQ